MTEPVPNNIDQIRAEIRREISPVDLFYVDSTWKHVAKNVVLYTKYIWQVFLTIIFSIPNFLHRCYKLLSVNLEHEPNARDYIEEIRGYKVKMVDNPEKNQSQKLKKALRKCIESFGIYLWVKYEMHNYGNYRECVSPEIKQLQIEYLDGWYFDISGRKQWEKSNT